MSNQDITVLSYNEQLIIVLVRMVAAGLSLGGSIFIILFTFVFGRMHHLSSRLIFYMASMSLCEAAANLMTYTLWNPDEHTDGTLCRVQGILLQFTQIAQFGWITVIAINLYLVVALFKDTKSMEKIYHVCVWSFASACTLVPTIWQHAYGKAGLWCWLTKDAGQPHRWLMFYIPLSIMWLTVAFFYILVIRTVRQKLGQAVLFSRASHDSLPAPPSIPNVDNLTGRKKATRLNHLLRAYPAIFVVLYAFPLINRIYNAFQPNNDIFFLWIMQALTAPLLGFSNAVAFTLEKKPMYCRTCYCCFYSCCHSRSNPDVPTHGWSSEGEKIIFSNG